MSIETVLKEADEAIASKGPAGAGLKLLLDTLIPQTLGVRIKPTSAKPTPLNQDHASPAQPPSAAPGHDPGEGGPGSHETGSPQPAAQPPQQRPSDPGSPKKK